MYVTSWTPDGKSLAYGIFSLATKQEETWILPVVGDRKPYGFLQAAFDEGFAAFSPDGRWMAYD